MTRRFEEATEVEFQSAVCSKICRDRDLHDALNFLLKADRGTVVKLATTAEALRLRKKNAYMYSLRRGLYVSIAWETGMLFIKKIGTKRPDFVKREHIA